MRRFADGPNDIPASSLEMPMGRSMLPIGIQDLDAIRETGSYYVDKTSLIRRLVEEGRSYFLSRPRRFGKSLLLDTLGVATRIFFPLNIKPLK